MNKVNSVGEILRAAREAKGETLEEANRSTKISVEVLGSLEQDDLDAIQSDIYLKGFVRTYAEHLGVDVKQVLAALDAQRGGSRTTSGMTWDVEETLSEERIKSPRIFRRFILPLLFVVILILILLLWNERRKVSRLTTDQAQGYVDGGPNASLVV